MKCRGAEGELPGDFESGRNGLVNAAESIGAAGKIDSSNEISAIKGENNCRGSLNLEGNGGVRLSSVLTVQEHTVQSLLVRTSEQSSKELSSIEVSGEKGLDSLLELLAKITSNPISENRLSDVHFSTLDLFSLANKFER